MRRSNKRKHAADRGRLDYSAEMERLRLDNLQLRQRNARQLGVIQRLEDRAERREGKLRLLLQEISERSAMPDWVRELPLVREAYAEFQPQVMDHFGGVHPRAETAEIVVLEDYGLELRIINTLDEWGVLYVRELLAKSQEWLLKLPNFSVASLKKTHDALRAAGYLAADEELAKGEERA